MNKPTPRKPEDNAGASAGGSGARRHRLPPEPTCPALSKVRVLLEEAEQKRGFLIELPWISTDQKNFILTVQWDANLKDPVWTLYEDMESGSKVVWTQPFAAQDLEFMYDILSMSAGSTGGGIPDELRMKPSGFEEAQPEKKEEPSFESFGAPSLSPFGNAPATGSGLTPPQAPIVQPGFPAFPATPSNSYSSLPSLQPGPPAGYNNMPPQQQQPYPQQQYQQQAPQPPYPQQQYPPQAQYPPQPNYPGYPPQQQQMPPGYPPQQQYQQPPAGYPGYPPQQQQQPYPMQQPPAPSYAADLNEPKIPLDYHLIDKRANILIGTLLQEAGLISEPTLEAALKLQEMVRDEKMSPDKAPEVLKRLHAMGGSIDQYLTKGDLEKAGSLSNASNNSAKPKAPPTQAKPTAQTGGAPAAGGRDLKGAFDLLQKAQLLTENDLTTANNVRKKHGGDIIQILEAAGKCNAKTVDAACTSLPLIREGLMKIEQVIMALNYCERMRVSFDDALDEMGWQNPRKIRTDLPL